MFEGNLTSEVWEMVNMLMACSTASCTITYSVAAALSGFAVERISATNFVTLSGEELANSYRQVTVVVLPKNLERSISVLNF